MNSSGAQIHELERRLDDLAALVGQLRQPLAALRGYLSGTRPAAARSRDRARRFPAWRPARRGYDGSSAMSRP